MVWQWHSRRRRVSWRACLSHGLVSPIAIGFRERYFLIVVDDYSRYNTVFPLPRKADVPTVLEPWLLARGGAQGLCGLRLHSDRSVVRYAVHQLNLWPSDARPRVTLVSLWTGSPGIAADFHVWGSLAHVRAPDAKKLSPRTHACIFLGFPLDASGWVFYDPVTYYVSHVTPQSSPPQRPVTIVSGGVGGAVAEVEGTGAAGACGVGSGGEGGVGVEFTPVEDMAALTQRPRPTSPPGFSSVPQFPPRTSLRVSHVTPQSSPPQRPVTIVSGGVGGAVAEVEGTGAAGACGVGSGGEGGVGVEFTPVEDMAALTQRPRPTSPPGFSSVPQFPPRTSLRSVAAEPGGIPAGGTGGTGGVGTGAAGSGDTGAGGTGTMAPSPRTVHFLTREQRLIRLETEEWEQFESARQQQQQKEEQS
ncbi:unnamed protein product [Closterium sp. NIES-54]